MPSYDVLQRGHNVFDYDYVFMHGMVVLSISHEDFHGMSLCYLVLFQNTRHES